MIIMYSLKQQCVHFIAEGEVMTLNIFPAKHKRSLL